MKKLLYVLITVVTLSAVLWGAGPVVRRQTLILAHNLDVQHPVHAGIVVFAERVKELSQGDIEIRVYPNGQLGSEREVLEQLQLGAVAFTKVSSLSLESFAPLIGVLNAPFLFRDQEHYYEVLDGELGDELLACAKGQKVLGLTYYNGGTRSFYSDRAILKPEDLTGMKLRVMGSQTAIKMTQLLGGSPAPMPYGEIYTALQQGVIDGAENNITALTLSRHGEVAKHYSADEHIMAPDILLVSTDAWKRLSPEHQDILKQAASESKTAQRLLWAKAVAEHRAKAERDLGVEFHQPDRAAFAEKVLPLHVEISRRGPDYQRLIEGIKTRPAKQELEYR